MLAVTAATSGTATTGSSDAPSVHASETATKSPSPTEPEESDEDSDMNIAESGDTLQRGTHTSPHN